MPLIKQSLGTTLVLLSLSLASCDKEKLSLVEDIKQETSTNKIEELALNITEQNLTVGQTLTLKPNVSPSTVQDVSLLWHSSEPKVASVSTEGEVVALAEGEARITAQIKDQPKIAASCLVTVRPKAEEKTEENKPNDESDTPNTGSGDKPSEGGNTGSGNGDKPGEGGNTGGGDKPQDEPKSIPVVGIVLSKQEHRLALGGELLLTAKIEPENATNKTVQWSSSHPEVASVSASGLVRAHRSGEATIGARTEDGGHLAQCRIIVPQPEPPQPPTPKVAVTAVSVELEPKQLQVGRELQMREVIIPNDATDKRVTWHLSNPEVATISPTGLLKGVKVGSTRITVRSADGGKEWTSGDVYITPFQLGVGDQYLNLVGVNTQGTPTSLKQIVDEGHYTLLDFWGDWCYYCKRDMPKIKGIWDKYRGHGLRVVGISSGDSFATHQRSVRELGITWPQIIDKNDSRAFGRIYGITGYPHVMLLDKTGKIIEWKIGAEEAENIIQSILDREGSL